MVDHNVLFNIVKHSGYWDDHVEDHSFLVSPDVYTLTTYEQNQLNDIGTLLPMALQGFDRLMHEASPSHKINAVINSGIPRAYRRMQREHLQVPEIVKVDLVKDTEERFWIMELDSINKHGWGLTALINKLRDVIAPDKHVLPSIVKTLAHAILGHEFYRDNVVTLISASHEHFYLPEFKILSCALQQYGISLNILEEPLPPQDVAALSIDFPFLFRSSKEVVADIAKAYDSSQKAFLLPPKPFLGSKAMMALVANQGEQNEIQEIVRASVPQDALSGLGAYIPPTFLVDKRRGHKNPHWFEYAQSNRCVLKACISCGGKQVHFPEDESYWDTVQKACRSNYSHVLQHEISPLLHKLRYYNRSGAIVEKELYCRFTAYFSSNGLVDLRVVARPDKKVHGAPDAVQIGVSNG